MANRRARSVVVFVSVCMYDEGWGNLVLMVDLVDLFIPSWPAFIKSHLSAKRLRCHDLRCCG